MGIRRHLSWPANTNVYFSDGGTNDGVPSVSLDFVRRRIQLPWDVVVFVRAISDARPNRSRSSGEKACSRWSSGCRRPPRAPPGA